ncbi:MAG: hypothetical protein JRI91_09910 [Deltaproteobacteria bacterium]|nr:hypothetical protein [Deltaproteobacteria bacterium]
MERPSGKELYNKIKQAKEAVSNNLIHIIDPAVVAADAIELGYQAVNLKNVLSDILEEIGPNHYAGYRPPQKSYKSEILGLELFAFRWVSKRFGCESYMKFSIMQGRMYLVSLHPHRVKKGE